MPEQDHLETRASARLLMVIFGAGASYDSLARDPPETHGKQWRPPLSDELFSPRWGPYITLFPQAASLITDLEKPGTNVESELEKFQNDIEQYPRLRVPLTAIRYYLQSMLSSCQGWWEGETRHVTNYNPLLLQIDRWAKGEKVLVSFNYDTLLEEALNSTLGVSFDSMDDYVTRGYKVIKPHGSINWWHRVECPQFPSPTSIPDDRIPMVIARAQELKISPVFELSTPTRASPLGIPTIPALALPVATKSEYECPDGHQKALIQSYQNVTKVLVIGWRATENRFLRSFAQGIGQNKPQFLVISRNEKSAVQVEQTIKARLRENGASAEYSHLSYGFSTAIKNHDFDGFLKS